MRGRDLLEKIGLADEKWVTDAEVSRRRRRVTVWVCRIAAVAAAVCLAMGIFVRTDAYLFSDVLESIYGPTTQMLRYKECIVEKHMAAYRLIYHSEHQQQMLEQKKGELYAQTKDTLIYRYAGRDDFVYLIFENEDGSLQMGEFMHFYAFETGAHLLESDWYEDWGTYHFTDEQLQTVVPVTFLETLRVIYGIEDEDDIRSLTFSWDYPAEKGREHGRIPIRNRQIISEFYKILSSLEYQADISAIPYTEKQAERQQLVEVLRQSGSDLMHLQRTLRIRLKSGFAIEMRYVGYLNRSNTGELRILYGADFRVSDACDDWFIKYGEIDFNHKPYVPQSVSGAETTVLPTTTYATTASETVTDPTSES